MAYIVLVYDYCWYPSIGCLLRISYLDDDDGSEARAPELFDPLALSK